MTLNQANGWTWTFEDLKKFEDGKEITYMISEDPVEGYTTSLTGSAEEGFTLTNSKKPETPTERPRNNPNTGDAGHIVLYAGLVLLSAACLGKFYFRTEREKEA
nr:Cna B-type domain-containing protein [Kallipyga massiliensis]